MAEATETAKQTGTEQKTPTGGLSQGLQGEQRRVGILKKLLGKFRKDSVSENLTSVAANLKDAKVVESSPAKTAAKLNEYGEIVE